MIKMYGINNQKPIKPKLWPISLYKNEKTVFVENNVTKAKRMTQIPPIIEIEFWLILYFSFILIHYNLKLNKLKQIIVLIYFSDNWNNCWGFIN